LLFEISTQPRHMITSLPTSRIRDTVWPMYTILNDFRVNYFATLIFSILKELPITYASLNTFLYSSWKNFTRPKVDDHSAAIVSLTDTPRNTFTTIHVALDARKNTAQIPSAKRVTFHFRCALCDNSHTADFKDCQEYKNLNFVSIQLDYILS
jgi:hypothetical protein